MSGANILFISELPPINTYASSVIFFRHFTELENKGNHIFWLTDQNSYNNRLKDTPASWQILLVPNRKWFMLPYKPVGLLQKKRFWIYYKFYTKSLLKSKKIDLIVSYLNGNFLSPFCAYVKKRSKLPLITFFHDDPLELDFYRSRKIILKNTAEVLKCSDEVLVASDCFINNWPNYANKFTLLFPIPDKFASSLFKTKTYKNQTLTFAYSGSVYNEIIPNLELIVNKLALMHCKLVIINNNEQTKYLEKQYPDTIICKSLFDTAEQANKFLIEHCQCLIIPYPEKIELMPWIKTCFPSKLIQFCQLELPILIVAPSNSAVGKWCLENNWQLYYSSYSKLNIKEIIYKIERADVKKQSTFHKERSFDPDNIQQQLEKTLSKYCRINKVL